jgi:hypothetical protein
VVTFPANQKAQVLAVKKRKASEGGVVYKITHKATGKAYVGSTTKTAAERFTQHKADNYSAISKAIKEYGVDSFTVEELAHAETIPELAKLEGEYIQKLNTLAPNGYNGTPATARKEQADADLTPISKTLADELLRAKGLVLQPVVDEAPVVESPASQSLLETKQQVAPVTLEAPRLDTTEVSGSEEIHLLIEIVNEIKRLAEKA